MKINQSPLGDFVAPTIRVVAAAIGITSVIVGERNTITKVIDTLYGLWYCSAVRDSIMRTATNRTGSTKRTAVGKVADVIKLDVQNLCIREGITNPFQLAEVTGLPYATCRRIWQGTPAMIGLNTIERLCDVLRVRPGQLFDYEFEADKPKRKRRSKGR